MRVLLIRPPVAYHTIGLKHIMICEPLELEYVAAGLEGHEVGILDMILEGSLDERLRRFNPDVVGTSCYITGVNEVKKICRAVKKWNPVCKTIVGGVQASCAPEDFADTSIDCIVRGDGTSIMPEILQSFLDCKPLQEIPGLVIPTGEGQLQFTGERPYLNNPDALPFPRRDLVAHLKHKYYYLFHQPVALLKTTWGCWYDCNFCCTWRVTNGQVYSRSPESIVKELEKIETREIYIVDDIFLFNPKRLSEIARLIREKGIRKNYLVYSRADFVAENTNVIREWAELGLRAVIIGLESSTNPELEAMNKRTTVDFNCRAIEVLRKHEVDTYGSFITQPDYMPQDWKRLQNFIKSNDLYYVNISPLTPLPGTRNWKEYEDRITLSRKAHGLWDLSHCVLPTRIPLKKYYRFLLKTYAGTILDIHRASRLPLKTRPPVWSLKYLRLWFGALKIMFQFLNAHHHHRGTQLQLAMDTDYGRNLKGNNVLPRHPFRVFFNRHPEWSPTSGGLLDTPNAHRWFEMIKWGLRNDLYTYQQPMEVKSGPSTKLYGRDFLIISSNDYLGLIGHEGVESAAIEAIRKYGTGTGGVRLLSGTTDLHHRLEKKLAAFKGTEASIIFSSGYLANIGVISALLGHHDRVISDSRAHRSITDACRLARVPERRFEHNNAVSLEEALKSKPVRGRTLIVVEGVYSMDGDICPLPEIIELKKKYGAFLMVDEAHSFCVLGSTGRGVDEYFNVKTEDVDIWMGSLSKAIPASGGFIAGSQALIIYLQHGAAPFIFSGALSPASAAAAMESLRVIKNEPQRLKILHRNAEFLRSNLNNLGFDTGNSASPVIPVITGNYENACRISREMFRMGILAPAILFPAVSVGGSRIRLCATAAQDRHFLEKILAGFREIRAKEQNSMK